MLTWGLIICSVILWVLIWVIPFRHQIYDWYDRRWGR